MHQRSAALKPGCLAMDSQDHAYRVGRFLPTEYIETDLGKIPVEMVEVTEIDGTNPQPMPAFKLARAEWTTVGELLTRAEKMGERDD